MQPCPRKSEATLSSQIDHVSHWREDRTCSYCGSIAPAFLFESIEINCQIGPTDKNYKIYVDLIEPNPEELQVVGVSTDKKFGDGWTTADMEILKSQGFNGGSYKSMRLAPRGSTRHGKFYFQHFSKEECHRFIDLMNNGKLNIGYPGHFYVLPYFISYKTPLGKL